MNLLQWSANIVDKQPYNPGKVDCFRLVIDFAARVKGVDLPYEHDGITLDDYVKHYETNESKTIAVAMDYLKTNLTEIPAYRSIAGDVLIAVPKAKSAERIFFGIDGGNGKIVTVLIEGGTQAVKREHHNIIKAFKWAR